MYHIDHAVHQHRELFLVCLCYTISMTAFNMWKGRTGFSKLYRQVQRHFVRTVYFCAGHVDALQQLEMVGLVVLLRCAPVTLYLLKQCKCDFPYMSPSSSRPSIYLPEDDFPARLFDDVIRGCKR